jgi:hypothetical protein
VGPLGLGYGTFDNDVIELPIIVLTLSLGIKIAIGTSDDCQDCGVGGEGVGLLRGFLDLRWRWWVSFSFDLWVGVVWHWTCDLWNWQRVCYSWNW